MHNNHSKSSKYTIILLFSLFILPIVLAYIVYFNQDLFNLNTSNYGELIQPPTKLEQLKLADNESNPYDVSKMHGKWWLAYIKLNDCGESCEKNINKLESVHLALGKDTQQVSRIFIHTDSAANKVRDKALTTDHPNLKLAAAHKDRLQTFLQKYPNTTKQNEHGQFYIIDPNGRLILHYPVDAPGNGILRDMRHLLKVYHG